jgi:hypothetical protein
VATVAVAAVGSIAVVLSFSICCSNGNFFLYLLLLLIRLVTVTETPGIIRHQAPDHLV